jgi:hypothetical protein
MKEPTARELLDHSRAKGSTLAARVEKVLTAHAAGGGWACELCQTHLPCPTVRILNGEEL